MHARTRFLPILMIVLALALTACGSDDSASGDMSDMEGMDGSEMAEGGGEEDHAFAFGEPAEASDADRTVTIEASDELAWGTTTVEVTAGETIAFEIVNVGSVRHDFFLGPEQAQEEHEAEMEEMAEMDGEMAHDDPNAITIEPGTTETLAWTFTEPTTVLYGCHEPGHYEAGMVGTITVTEP